ncbi:hypothetical protein GCM10010399_38450 [Dactylosporangium fulvum]|uniref:Uncharacterized protein n=1 Tax=Dactylosporangium fulvum TaxID=53359 RepID=A0ABY5W3P7_9ACTN|nr:hypothetical protein [Dactylosporangium fulvum]UWP84084.1 hypothetical protein Dfulv_07485 [Dactylosporangium fulvum]
MPDSTTPASPEPTDEGNSTAPDTSAGVSSAPTAGTPASPSTGGPDGPDAPEPPTAPAPPAQPSGTGRGGCMTTMIGLFVFIAALLGIATQL